jgi:EAL domain-containing protein (putative c-di-GMP-specific phosphodiesterase class I)/ActR/RegA family two-component response regulator
MHLLIVDDEREICRFVEFVAQDCGWTVACATSEVEFRAAYGCLAPQAIVMDLHLGDSDGIEQLRFLAAAKFPGHILFLSGQGERVLAAAAERARTLGLDVAGAQTKPIGVAALRSVLWRMAEVKAPSASKRPIQDFAPEPGDVLMGLNSGQLELFLQPIVSAGGTVVKLEALTRWRHPEFGMIHPRRIVAAAERDQEVVDAFTSWALDGAVELYCALKAEGWDIPISINVSRGSLRELDLPDRIAALVQRAGMPPSALAFEVTDSTPSEDAGDAIEILARLSLKGFPLLIDDFGAGYSTLLSLRHTPLWAIKLDKSFTAGLPQSRDNLAIVKSVVELARSLRLQIVAKGVETAEQANCLTALGVHALQGYFFTEPLPFDQAVAWLKSHSAAVNGAA